MNAGASHDGSNGYESLAGEFIACRSQSSIGIARIREWAKGLRPGAAVLDIGCGHDVPISQTLIDNGFDVYGVDASPSMIAAYRAQFTQAHVECNTVENSRFFDRTFDGIVAWGLIFLLTPEAQSALIQRVAGVLNRGGHFLFTSPWQACAWPDVMTGRSSVSLGADAYRRLLAAAGLDLAAELEDENGNHYYAAVKS